ncbi:fimbrin-1 [Anaeramoeba ignava]|uniref:Fimbrin-1 n=1 Tax=Anaeramoeba ignava TaxID=1746090 RepID=A0A9Q0LNK9_ANAIG|nr:fimbrin-1 [Anaeramoeba ignava]|eukprot:Anaeramoba_ignava/a608477_65.p1 GENE.a608477_65~~a608477_65.p1  ORF type:complete len:1095 (-),score=374.36 a608477_65:23-3307(-)
MNPLQQKVEQLKQLTTTFVKNPKKIKKKEVENLSQISQQLSAGLIEIEEQKKKLENEYEEFKKKSSEQPKDTPKLKEAVLKSKKFQSLLAKAKEYKKEKKNLEEDLKTTEQTTNSLTDFAQKLKQEKQNLIEQNQELQAKLIKAQTEMKETSAKLNSAESQVKLFNVNEKEIVELRIQKVWFEKLSIQNTDLTDIWAKVLILRNSEIAEQKKEKKQLLKDANKAIDFIFDEVIKKTSLSTNPFLDQAKEFDWFDFGDKLSDHEVQLLMIEDDSKRKIYYMVYLILTYQVYEKTKTELETLKKEEVELKKKITQNDEKIKKIKKKNKDLKEEVKKLKDLESKNEATKILEYQKEIEELKKQKSSVESLLQQEQIANQKNEKLAKDNDEKYKKAQKSVDEEKEEKEKLKKELEKLRKELTESKNQNEEYKKDIDEHKNKYDKLSKEYEEMLKKNKTGMKDLEKNQLAKIEELTKQNQALGEENKKLKEENQKLKKSQEDSEKDQEKQKKLEEYEKKLEKKKNKAKKYKNESKENKNKLENKEKENEELRKELEALKLNMEKKEEKITDEKEEEKKTAKDLSSLPVKVSTRAISPTEEFIINFVNEAFKNDPDLEHLIPIGRMTADLLDASKDGVLLCKLVNYTAPGTIDERVINYNGNREMVKENYTLCLSSARSIGCDVTNINAEKLADLEESEVINLAWQIMKSGTTNYVNLHRHPELMELHEAGVVSQKDLETLTPEEILLRWFNYHLAKANHKRKVQNFTTDLADGENLTVLLSQLSPEHCDLTKFYELKAIDQRVRYACDCSKAISPQLNISPDVLMKGEIPDLITSYVGNIFHVKPGLQSSKTSEINHALDYQSSGTREERAFKIWINSLGVDPKVNNLYEDLKDGFILLQVLDKIEPGCVDWKKINTKPSNLYQTIENCNYVIELGRSLGFQLVSISGSDIVKANKMLVLGYIWQAMEFHIKNILKKLNVIQSGRITDKSMTTWANNKVKEAGKSSQISSLKDPSIKNAIFFIDLIYAIRPEAVNYKFVKAGDDEEQCMDNALYAITLSRKLGADIFALPEDIVEVKPKMLLTVLGELMRLHKLYHKKK